MTDLEVLGKGKREGERGRAGGGRGGMCGVGHPQPVQGQRPEQKLKMRQLS